MSDLTGPGSMYCKSKPSAPIATSLTTALTGYGESSLIYKAFNEMNEIAISDSS